MTNSENDQSVIREEAAQLALLIERCNNLRHRAFRLTIMRRFAVSFSMIVSTCSIGWLTVRVFFLGGLSSVTESSVVLPITGLVYSAMALIFAVAISPRRLELDLKDAEDEIDLRQMKSASLEEKAHKLLRIQQGQLARYLDVILQQSRGIFFVGIAAMLVGVFVVLFTIWQTKSMDANIDTWQKAIVGIVGAIGAILTNYVAAIYLKMFSDIGAAVQKSVTSLSQSNNINFANVLVSNITSEDGRNDTLKQIAIGISKQA